MKKRKISVQEQNRRFMQSLHSHDNIRYDEFGNRIDFIYNKKLKGYRLEHK